MNQFIKDNWPHMKTFWNGYQTFQQTGETPVAAYHAMRRLFCQSNGRLNDAFQTVYALKHPYSKVNSLNGSLLKGFTEQDCRKAVDSLREDGFYKFPVRIESEQLQTLIEYSLHTPAILQTDGGGRVDSDEIFDPNNLIASNYRFREQGLISVPFAQQLMADPVLLTVAKQYIQSEAILDNISMWWTTPYGCTAPSARLAQMFHFDMDRIKFMKYFLYLTDVGPNDGPHCYIRGSCKRKPEACLEDRRYTDEELARHFPANDFAEITGPRGTIIAVDTRGFHKAKLPVSGNRLILQMQFVSSLFGDNYPVPELNIVEPKLEQAVKAHPLTYSHYRVAAKQTTRQPALV